MVNRGDGECPNCGEMIGTMMAAHQFHKCKQNRLTLEEAIADKEKPFLSRQYIDAIYDSYINTMRENARLRESLQCVQGYFKCTGVTYMREDIKHIVDTALSNKDSND